MKFLPPVSIETRRLMPSKWDVVAALLVLGFIVAFAGASRSLGEPLARLLPPGGDPRLMDELRVDVLAHAVKHNEVVSGAVHLGELQKHSLSFIL